jgi:hypothetical protein
MALAAAVAVVAVVLVERDRTESPASSAATGPETLEDRVRAARLASVDLPGYTVNPDLTGSLWPCDQAPEPPPVAASGSIGFRSGLALQQTEVVAFANAADATAALADLRRAGGACVGRVDRNDVVEGVTNWRGGEPAPYGDEAVGFAVTTEVEDAGLVVLDSDVVYARRGRYLLAAQFGTAAANNGVLDATAADFFRRADEKLARLAREG